MSASARYGDPAATLGVVNDVLSLQLAHRSVRKFDSREVTDGELSALVAAAQSAPTSSNLQPWSVIAVRDPERKARLARLAGDQAFIEQAPLFLVWVADLGRARRLAQRAGVELAAVDYAAAADAHIAIYDERLSTYNARFGLPGTWSDRVLDRLRGPESMAGRHQLRGTLGRLGLPSQ